jgi:hypothetical protein
MPKESKLSSNCMAIAWDSVEAYIVADSIDEFTAK